MRKLAYIFILFSFNLFAQDQVQVSAELDTLSITIGDQVNFNVKVQRSEGASVEWPVLDGKLGELEIVKSSERSTLEGDLGFVETQQFKLTAFDSGYYAVPGLLFKYRLDDASNEKQVRTKAALLRVETIPIDTTELSIQPIKGRMDVPFHWKEAIPYVLGGLGVLLSIALILFLISRRKKIQVEGPPPPPARPAHEVALEKLKSLDRQQVWQKGEIKAYYTDLTEILREYVENRFDVPALELTTDEIVAGMKDVPMEQALKEKFFALLRMADLVKFAKASPDADSHNRALKSGEAFVQHTKNLQQSLNEIMSADV